MKLNILMALATAMACLATFPAAAQESVADRLKRGEACFRQRDYAGAADALGGLTEKAAGLKPPQRLALYRYLAAAQRHTVADPADRGQAAERLAEALEEMAGAEKATPKERLVRLLQAAGARGLADDFDGMNRRLDEMLDRERGVEAATVVEALQDAALFYMATRDYDIVEALKARGDARFEKARVRNRTRCRFESPMPVGAGGWAQSALLRDPSRREARFHPYPRGQEEMLLADMAAERAVDEKTQTALEGRDTAFFMGYDEKGWHMFIQSDEPNIETVMMQEGKGGSSLEMFFAPGQEGEAYYQWIIRLGTGEVNLYNYNTPHRFYRNLELAPRGFRTETAALEKGWGTSIFIPWESLYDKLPFMPGNESAWRFSIMRWGPVSLTWGGKVHEPGRWGLIDWEPPSPEQRTAILRYLIQRAWWRFQAVKAEAADYWQGSRGDTAFYQQVLEPAMREQEQTGEKMKDVAQWAPELVEQVFAEQVPEWMEFRYRIETLRADYLAEKLTAVK